MSTPRLPRERVFLPGFIPRSLYLAFARQAVNSSSSSLDITSVEFLGFFYLEKPTLPPNAPTPCLQGRYWFFTPAFGSQQGEMPVQTALHHENILGYARVAERVDLDKLKALVTQDDHKLDSVASSEGYVFNVMNRLRRQGILRAEAVFWTFDRFQSEHQRLRRKWMEQRRAEELKEEEEHRKRKEEERKEEVKAKLKKFRGNASNASRKRSTSDPARPPASRPFTEFVLCNPFTTQEHPYL